MFAAGWSHRQTQRIDRGEEDERDSLDDGHLGTQGRARHPDPAVLLVWARPPVRRPQPLPAVWQVGLPLGRSMMRPPGRSRTSRRAAVVLAALLVVVLAPAATGISSSRSSAEEVAARASTPTAVDVAAVDRFLGEQIDAASIPGAAVAITHGDQVIHLAGFGHDSTGAPVTADTLFRIASLSKSFTALAVMQLVDEHRLSLDDPVVDHLPEFRIADPRGADITVRQLLEQTSGLADSTVHPLARQQPGSLAEAVSSLSCGTSGGPARHAVELPQPQLPGRRAAGRGGGRRTVRDLPARPRLPSCRDDLDRHRRPRRPACPGPGRRARRRLGSRLRRGRAEHLRRRRRRRRLQRRRHGATGSSCRPTTAVPSTALRSSATAA